MALSLQLASTGRDPAAVFKAILVGGFGSPAYLAETLTRTIPLLLCALAAALPARGGLLNIGGEGQFHCGAIGATAVVLFAPSDSRWLTLLVMFLAAAILAGLCGAIPGVLRGWFGVDEVLISLMLNFVAILALEHLVHGAWRDPDALGWPYSALFPAEGVLPTLGTTKVHLGLLFGIVLAGMCFVVLRHTTWGFATKILESSTSTARYLGIPISRYMIGLMILGAAIAGLAGLGEVSVVQGRLRPDMSPGYGYTGFLIAWLARNHFLWIVLVAFAVGGLYTGSDALQVLAGLPSATVDIFMGTVFLCFIVGEGLRRRFDPTRAGQI